VEFSVYVFERGKSSEAVMEAMERAARRGVAARGAGGGAGGAAGAAAAEARLAAAAALGDVRVDPSWRPRVAVLRDALDKLRVDVDRDPESATIDER